MNTTQVKRSKHDIFFEQMNLSASDVQLVKGGRPDVFERIADDLERGEAARADQESDEASGARRIRDSWEEEYANVGRESSFLSQLISDSYELLKAWGKTIATLATVAVAIAVLIMVVQLGVGKYRAYSERQARIEQIKKEKQDAFFKSGWRESEKRQAGGDPFEINSDFQPYTAVAYLKDLSPDDGRVHLLLKDHGNSNLQWVLSGWTRTEEQRQQAAKELQEFLNTKDIGTVVLAANLIDLRPQGGTLQPDEIRYMYSQSISILRGGKTLKAARIEYGESGYAIIDPSIDNKLTDLKGTKNMVDGQPPPEGTPYYYVIGAGGIYWKTGPQRQALIEAARERLSKTPDGGKGARAIRLVYYSEGDNPQFEDIEFAQEDASPVSSDDSTNKTLTTEKGKK